MAIFQFNIRDQHGVVVDEDGIELSDALAAAQEAIRSVNEFFAEASPPTDMTLEVTDEVGRLVLVVPVCNHAVCADEEDPALAF